MHCCIPQPEPAWSSEFAEARKEKRLLISLADKLLWFGLGMPVSVRLELARTLEGTPLSDSGHQR
jgi:hypothetical protein